MASEQQPRDSFMAAIEAKIAAWTAVLDSYRAAVSLDGPVGDPGAPVGPGRSPNGGDVGRPVDLPIGVFRDKSIKEAIEIYLTAGRRKQTNKEIAIGLQKGGIATTSTNFEATIATALGRMKDEGTVLRFPDGWDLASSYPESLRNRLEKETKPKRVAKRVKAPKSVDRPKKPRQPKGEDKTAVMADLIANSGPSGVSVNELVDVFAGMEMPVSPDYVRVVTKRLRARGSIAIRDGRFYAPATGTP